MYLLVVMIELLDTWLEKDVLPSYGDYFTKEAAMSLAIDMANKGLGFVAPNPLVGAVILDQEERFVCAGYHAKYGEQHAEAHALSLLDNLQKSGCSYKIFVSLEPCSHQGKQPACAHSLLKYPIKEVYFAMKDPNTEVAGNGQKILQGAGLICEQLPGFEEREANQNRIFYHRCFTDRPFVAIKVAIDRNGYIAARGDRQRSLTSPRSRKYTHFIRAQYDAVMVGAETLLLDEPQLNTRDFCDGKVEPYKIIIAGKATLESLDPSCKTLQQDKLLFVTDIDFKNSKKIISENQCVRVERDANGIFAADNLLQSLKEKGINSVMIEGGAATFKAFLDAKLLDYIHLFTAPTEIEAEDKIHWYQGKSEFKFKEKRCFAIGLDQVLESFVEYS